MAYNISGVMPQHASTCIIFDTTTTGYRGLTSNDFSSAANQNQFSTVSNFSSSAATGTVFTLADGEKGYIANLSTGVLWVKLGTGANNTSFNYVLQGGTAVNDGKGGEKTIADFVGSVSASGAIGVSYIAFKLS